MKQIDHGMDMAAIRRRLDALEWEEDPEDDARQVRSVFLGTVFALTPSGKYYTPFACSNVRGCASCGGSGRRPQALARRVVKRRLARYERAKRAHAEALARGAGTARTLAEYRRAYRLAESCACTSCDGLGSREAAQDQAWYAAIEEALGEIGACLQSGEGDPCDLFASEWRDACDADEDADGAQAAIG